MEHLQSLSFLNILFYGLNVFWVIEFFIFNNRQQRGRFQENKSFYWLSFAILLTIGLTLLLNRNDVGRYVEAPFYQVIQMIALGFYTVGLLLRYTSSMILGKHFTRHVRVDKNMILASTGPYRFLRHPLYVGLWLITLAFPLFVGNWISFLFGLIVLTSLLLVRMRFEERALTTLHPEYQSWKRKRYRFIPFIF
jgi:protein-S-isoprenylcysteine O-methyltransferase Ste14